MHIKQIFLFLYLFTAVLEDFHSRRIPNWWIVVGLGAGALSLLEDRAYPYHYYVIGCLIPFFLLILLYGIRVLGAGDIKLFMVTGLFMGSIEILQVIAWSFLFGGIYAFIRMVRRKNFRQRFAYLFSYVKRVAISGKAEDYVAGSWEEEIVLHFSLCILLGCLPVMGGVML